ncbi:MAG: septum formation initiator family protein [Flavobacteriales bacterium]|jgi:cell division protein FtsB|nr:septum formation initiator family protein [Flavobacteriales bacterium]
MSTHNERQSFISKIWKYKLLIFIILFVLWIVFFDRNSVMMHIEREKNIASLQDSIEYYKREIERLNLHLEELQNDPREMEKFVRERYNMKRDDEDIYIIEKQ